ncbi:MAG: signal recognition particle receptor subunit alpha, partial [Alphaproteobacteria bacterium]|nr:signal recognition particle receptor subunit alpha [Alphaproteobacteria bacterium]
MPLFCIGNELFNSFANRISSIFEKLKRSGVLKEADVEAALREIRIALLEADVSLAVAKKFIADVKEKAIGANVLKSISPDQLVVKIVYDHLIELLGVSDPLRFDKKPQKIMLVGLQGAGKTTTAGKLAKFCIKNNKKVLLASTDIYRPAAISQLKILASKVDGANFLQTEDDLNKTADQIA